MTHLTPPWSHHNFYWPRFILWGHWFPYFRLCGPSPWVSKSEWFLLTCLHAVNLRVKSGCHSSNMDWKNWKNENFFQSGKSEGILNRLEKSGNFAQNTGKMRDFYPKCWKNGRDFYQNCKSDKIWASFYHYFFSDFLIKVYLLNRFLKMKRKYRKSWGNLSSANNGTIYACLFYQ